MPAEIPEQNLAYPVLATFGQSQGSGFFLNDEAQATWFITAKHVMFDSAGKLHSSAGELLAYSKDPSETAANSISLNLKDVESAGNLKPDPNADVVAVKLGTREKRDEREVMTPAKGVTLNSVTKSGLVGVDARQVRKLDKVRIGNDAYVFGYPNSIGLAHIPQVDPKRPLVRKGSVAGVNPALRTIILDCQVFPGNSGGLVVEVEREALVNHFYTIGLVAQYVPFDNARFGVPANLATLLNSGYSIVIPADIILELVS
jgi:hypothetical protein